MKITAFDDLFPLRAGTGGGVVYVASGSNGAAGDTSSGGDVTGSPGDYSVVGLRRTVSLASNIGGGTVGDVLTIIGTSPRLAMFATPSNSAVGVLNDLTDVTITSASSNQRLRYNASLAQWTNSSLIWRPVMTSAGSNWLVAVDGSGNAIMTEA